MPTIFKMNIVEPLSDISNFNIYYFEHEYTCCVLGCICTNPGAQ